MTIIKKFIKVKLFFKNMKIIKEEENKNYILNTKELDLENLPNLNSKINKQILELIAEEPLYPKQIAKKLKLHEQNVYYYIRKLESAKIIKISKQENINGTIANFYSLVSDSFFFKLTDFKTSSKISQKESTYLKPFIQNSEMNSIIVVGSPDPHGPQKARSKDGYFGMDLALFLGSYIGHLSESKVKLDTEITNEELKNNNLIIIGGPIVNRVMGIVNKDLPIYFDEEKKGVHSKISKKTYFSDEIGFINKIKSPFNSEKEILTISGLRNSGTKSAILAFLKHFNELKLANQHSKKYHCRVVEGIDLDSDGKVDDIEFLE